MCAQELEWYAETRQCTGLGNVHGGLTGRDDASESALPKPLPANGGGASAAAGTSPKAGVGPSVAVLAAAEAPQLPQATEPQGWPPGLRAVGRAAGRLHGCAGDARVPACPVSPARPVRYACCVAQAADGAAAASASASTATSGNQEKCSKRLMSKPYHMQHSSGRTFPLQHLLFKTS